MAKTYEDIKVGANTFTSAARTLDIVGNVGKSQLGKEKGLEVLAQALVPAIALKGFSCELALKSLIAKAGKNVGNQHELDVLFLKLNSADQNAISTRVINEIKKEISSYDYNQFCNDLHGAAKTFIEWRYFYEKSVTANLTFIEILFNELNKYINGK